MLAIIPARGGSKGVPRKNIRVLGDKPLINWTIEAALNAKSIDRVILSTDDPEIAEICRGTGIEVPFMRPSELAQDNSLAIDNYIYTMDRLIDEFNYEGDEFVVLLPTVPFRTSADIDASVDLFYKKNATTVISSTELPHPVNWVFYIDDEGRMKKNDSADESKKLLNRQSLEVAHIPNGGVYVFKHTALKNKKSYYSGDTYTHKMPAERSIDIDTEYDFLLAMFQVERLKRTYK